MCVERESVCVCVCVCVCMCVSMWVTSDGGARRGCDVLEEVEVLDRRDHVP